LVPLYKLPSAHETVEKLRKEGIIIRRAYPFELSRVRRFILKHFAEI
jgi:hypothetical protein